MSTLMSEVYLLGADLADGQSVRVVCPKCNGGEGGERSLSVTRNDEGHILFYCFRASCTFRGRKGGRDLIRIKRKPTTMRPYTGELFPLDEGWRTFLRGEIGFDEKHLEVAGAMVTASGCIAYPIYGPMGLRRGYVLRAFDGRVPKALTRMDVEESPSSWYRGHQSDAILVVEDIASAVRANRYVDVVAANGMPSHGTVCEIAAHYRRVVWALDADATGTALTLHKRHALNFDQSRVMVLERDLKDETEERLKCLLVDCPDE